MRRATPGSEITCTSESGCGAAPAGAAMSRSASESNRTARMQIVYAAGASEARRYAHPTMASARKLLLVLCFTALPANAGPSSLPLTLVADVPLPGGATRFDYQWIDADRRRLYIAHLGDSSLVVFDLDTQSVVQEVPGLASVHGVVAAPPFVLATATADKTLVIIDDRTVKVTARVPAGEYPNGLAFDPASGRA